MNIHGEQRKRNKPGPGQGAEKLPRPGIHVPRRPLRMEPRMMQHHQVARTNHRQPNPPHLLMAGKTAQQAGGQHDEIRRDSDDQVRAGEAGDEGEVEQDEGGGQGPVDVAQPEDLAVEVVCCVGDVFVVVGYGVVGVGDALAGGEGEVGYEGEGCY